jgi:hypothetical protein
MVDAFRGSAEMSNDGAKTSWRRHVYSTISVLERVTLNSTFLAPKSEGAKLQDSGATGDGAELI